MPRFFISYRRDDVPGHAGRLYDSLVREFGEDDVYMDVDRMTPGDDFVARLDTALRKAKVVIVVIGPRWLAAEAPERPRVFDPADFVRRELVTAFERNLPVIPVLIEEADMPRAAALPDALAEMAHRQAVDISDTRWHTDVQRLTTALVAAERLYRRPPPIRWEASGRADLAAASAVPGPADGSAAEWARLDDRGRIYALAYAPDGSMLAAGTDGGAAVWDVRAGQELHLFLPASRIASVDFNADGTLLAAAGAHGVSIWDLGTGEQRVQFESSATHSVAFSPCGRYVITQTVDVYDGMASVHDACDGRHLMTFYAGIRTVFSEVAWSSNERLVATLNTDRVLKLYELPGPDAWTPGWTPAPEPLTEVHDCLAVAFSPNGLLSYAVPSFGQGGSVELFNVEDRSVVQDLPHREAVNSLAFSSDGRRLATLRSRTVYLWDLATAELEAELPHRSPVLRMAFSADGRRLAAAEPTTVTLWAADTARETGRLALDGDINRLAFGPDGSTLATATDEAVYIWRNLPHG